MFGQNKILNTGIYRTNTPISKLQFRLTIQKIHSLIDVPVLEGVKKALKNEEQPESGSNETRTIRWQEKVFSRYEIDYYGVKENCKTDHQKLYFNRLKLKTHESDILFTYINGDNYYPDDLLNHCRHQLSQLPDSNVQSMYLMADLKQEVLLFSIHWFSDDGLMLVYPDFNHMSVNPYYHEVRGSHLQMFHYALEKCTSLEQHIVKPATALTVSGSTRKTLMSFSLAREKRFSMPKPLYRHLLILFEIVGASAFKFDGIHIRYQIELPLGVKNAEGKEKLLGSTHASKYLNGSWHFGHCHELLLMIPEGIEKQLPNVDLFFEAISIDDCQRERCLGHSHFSIPLLPQRNELTLNFLQLTNSDALYDRFEALLVGNRRKVDLVSFYAKEDQNILNRYGNETSLSGKLQVRYQTIRQHQPKVLNEGFYKTTRKGKDITLRELIAAYNAARERLEEFVELKY